MVDKILQRKLKTEQ